MNEPMIHKSIGKLLLEDGQLNLSDIELIEHCQKEQGLRFGEAAVKLGLISEADMLQILARQFDYPYLKPGEGGLNEELIAAFQPFSSQTEAIRSLRTQLTLRWFDGERKQLALIGLGTGYGCSLLAANLAIVFSQLGQRALLIDANLRNPCQHQLFNLSQSVGLSELLVGRANTEAICKIPYFANLSVLTAGTLPPNPQELLGKSSFKLLLRSLEKQYDVILLDTPDALVYADTQSIVMETGAALIAMQKNNTRVSDALSLQTQLADSKTQIVGVVLNEAWSRENS